jgi:hypothetical protein
MKTAITIGRDSVESLWGPAPQSVAYQRAKEREDASAENQFTYH